MHVVLRSILGIAMFLGASHAPVWAQTPRPDNYELMKLFAETFEQIERNYVNDVDREELMQAAIQGMLQKLDRYSNYISPEELQAFNESVEQEFGGIGIQVDIDPRSNRLIVISPMPGTPAYKSGVKAGDTIVEIEGASTEGFSIRDAQKLLKGPPGVTVTIGVTHQGSDEIVRLPIVREIIQMKTVLGDRYNGQADWEFLLEGEQKIGYIRLTHFSNRSADELIAALTRLKEQGMKALILDLRSNPGGLLSQAIEIADLFIDEGVIVSTKGRNSPERSWNAAKDNTITDVPMAVLINRYSASASEILSACLQDHKRAIVVGERSWGKGSVQNVIPLDGEKSALKLTTASYHRPSGKNIHRFAEAKEEDVWGVVPDDKFLRKLTNDEMRAYAEYRRARDVLDDDGPPETEFKDPHLTLAVEHLVATLGSTADEKAGAEDEKPKKVAEEDQKQE